MPDTPPADPADATGLRALYVNCSLKRDPAASHTQLLMSASAHILTTAGAHVDTLHMASAGIAPGIYPDMTEHGWPSDAWPVVWPLVRDADILVIGTPLWLGEESSLCRILIERLYAMSGELNDKGQSVYYGKAGGAVITGNEDGIKHTAMSLHFALGHLGYMIPPQADCGWIGEAGPGPSYGDAAEGGGRVGFNNDFTRNNTIIMSWNLIHTARMLKAAGGLPGHGNDRRALKAGERFGFRAPSPPDGF